LAAARASFLSLPPLVCHDKSIASNTHNRVIDKKKTHKVGVADKDSKNDFLGTYGNKNPST
jgi:hypothetical protein